MPFYITPAGETIAMVSFGLAIMSSLVRRAVLDREKMEHLKGKMKEHQQIMKEAGKSGDKKKMSEAQNQFTQLLMEQMKHSFKPMFITIIPFILVFGWLRGEFSQVGEVANLFGFGLSWFWWYLICAMVVSTMLNKILKVS